MGDLTGIFNEAFNRADCHPVNDAPVFLTTTHKESSRGVYLGYRDEHIFAQVGIFTRSLPGDASIDDIASTLRMMIRRHADFDQVAAALRRHGWAFLREMLVGFPAPMIDEHGTITFTAVRDYADTAEECAVVELYDRDQTKPVALVTLYPGDLPLNSLHDAFRETEYVMFISEEGRQ